MKYAPTPDQECEGDVATVIHEFRGLPAGRNERYGDTLTDGNFQQSSTMVAAAVVPLFKPMLGL